MYVNPLVSVIMDIPATELCTDHAPIVISVSESGGYMTANGLNLSQMPDSTFSFDPSDLAEGTYEIVYTLPDDHCGGNATGWIDVYESPIVTLTGPSSIMIDHLPVTLQMYPPGGLLTVNDTIAGASFDPAYWGLGTHNVVYSYDNGHCEDQASLQITVGTVGIDDIDISNSLNLYPNPMSDVLNIGLDDVKVSEIQIFDIAGKVLYSTGVDSDHLSVDVSGFAPGMYFVRFVMQDGIVSEPFKVMKQ
jgi:hypothetical protein